MNPVDLHLPYDHSEADLIRAFAKAAHISQARAAQYAILRKSIDARKKNDIRIVYQVAEQAACPALLGVAGLVRGTGAGASGQLAEQSSALAAGRLNNQTTTQSSKPRIVVIGAGPAGLFATLYLALAGRRPLLIERGQPVEQRQIDVARFWNGGRLDPESNVQFGEGGAGTFSDGKLTTGIRDPRCRAVLEELVLLGAPQEILYLAKPHVGTDRLRAVVMAMRRKIQQLGGEVRFGTRLTGLATAVDSETGHQQRLTGVIVEPTGKTPIGANGSAVGSAARCAEELPAAAVILAVGHSARDTFRMLQQTGVTMAQKPFSVGLRIEHRQHQIDLSQYGSAAGHPNLPPAEYKLSCQLPDGRAVYTFCMCPGGQVIASASAEGEVVTNGMSHFSRDGENANSALLVPVGSADFASSDPLAGMHFQQKLEQAAFLAGGGHHQAPAQRVGEFLSGFGGLGTGFGDLGGSFGGGFRTGSGIGTNAPVNPTYTNGVTLTNLAAILPAFVTDSLRNGLPLLSRKLHGFADPGAILTGVETRSSSPVRIVRDESGQSSLPGLYPCGEGAGYAGGIMSAAVDGLRCAEAACSSVT